VSAKSREGDVPTYQYACTACGHNLEAVQSFTDEPLTECPECTGRLRKVFSSVGIVFKGSGFYRTDSRAGNGANGSAPAKETDSSTKDSAGKDSGGKADAGAKKDTGGKSAEGGTNGTGKSGTSATSSSSGSTAKAGTAA
jgi:putative FmdB family regulatory protein